MYFIGLVLIAAFGLGESNSLLVLELFNTHLTFICSKPTIETPEKGGKNVQS